MTHYNLLYLQRYPLKEGPLVRVYPWGSSSLKQKRWSDVNTAKEAKDLVIKTLPDPAIKVVTDELHELLYDAYSTVPSRLPVVFFASK